MTGGGATDKRGAEDDTNEKDVRASTLFDLVCFCVSRVPSKWFSVMVFLGYLKALQYISVHSRCAFTL